MLMEETIMKKTLPAFFIIILLLFTVNTSGENDGDKFQKIRKKMVASQIKNRGIQDPLVLEAMKTVPRHRFVPRSLWGKAYGDHPIPIGGGQTISQPYIVALMTEIPGLKGNERVLEIGTGSGYQAAILSRIVKDVYSIEIKEKLQKRASKLLEKIGKIGTGK